VLLKKGCVRRAAIVGTPPLHASVDRIDSKTDSTTSQRINASTYDPEKPHYVLPKSKDIQ
jgi:hypothetical protein